MFHNANQTARKHIEIWMTILLLALATFVLFMALSFSFTSAIPQRHGKNIDKAHYAQCIPGDECPGSNDTWGNG